MGVADPNSERGSTVNKLVGTTATTSISLSWTSAGSEVDSYETMWTSYVCPDDVDEGSATITEGLREGTSYTITVSATNSLIGVHSTMHSCTPIKDTQL